MRYINLEQLDIPVGWKDQADIASADGDENINDHSAVWGQLKEPLKKISHKKCYYCEIIQERSDGAVDHFRPKDYYKWLAFSSANYRFACTYCNSRRKDKERGITGGKGNFFPLLDETKRATCVSEVANESPILLDPCKPNEPGLIDFDEIGRPIPTYLEEEDAVRYKRAHESIKLYHLDHSDLIDKRKAHANSINRKIIAANSLYPETEKGNSSLDDSFSEHVRCLANYISERAELSVFARRILEGHRNIRWVETLLRCA